jgi:predicted RNase H-like nuclease (RuvC/YqgF family)
LEAAGYDPVSVRELQERVEALQRELGRLEGRLESEENARRYLEADRVLLAKRLERERVRREEVERERDELVRRLEALSGPPSVEEATVEVTGREALGQADGGTPTDPETRSWWRSVFGRHRLG